MEDKSRIGRPVMDLTGMQFGRLAVTHRAPSTKQGTMWACACACGASAVVWASSLRKGYTRSCGCLRREATGSRQLSHGHAKKNQKTGAYSSYWCARTRCTNPGHKSFSDYGGRGIEFRFGSFADFLAELGPRPLGTTLDRIDVNGNYEAGNVRWATPSEQERNKRCRAR